jgi:hypothetical protein
MRKTGHTFNPLRTLGAVARPATVCSDSLQPHIHISDLTFYSSVSHFFVLLVKYKNILTIIVLCLS